MDFIDALNGGCRIQEADPTSTFGVDELSNWGSIPTTIQKVYYRHNNRATVAFYDGHVNQVSSSEIWDGSSNEAYLKYWDLSSGY